MFPRADNAAATNRPLVDVIVAAHNAAPTIEAALRKSLLKERAGAIFEIIVVDDASTDDTAARAAGLPCVRVIRQDRNEGAYVARNVGTRCRTCVSSPSTTPTMLRYADA